MPLQCCDLGIIRHFFSIFAGTIFSYSGRHHDKGGTLHPNVPYSLRLNEARAPASTCPMESWFPISGKRQGPPRFPGHRPLKVPHCHFRSWLLLARPQGLQERLNAQDQHRLLDGQDYPQPGTRPRSLAPAGGKGLVRHHRLGMPD